jgi:hypothetical protein
MRSFMLNPWVFGASDHARRPVINVEVVCTQEADQSNIELSCNLDGEARRRSDRVLLCLRLSYTHLSDTRLGDVEFISP